MGPNFLTLPETEREREKSRDPEVTKLFFPHHEMLRLTVYKELGQSVHAAGVFLPGSEPLSSGQDFPGSPPSHPRLRA